MGKRLLPVVVLVCSVVISSIAVAQPDDDRRERRRALFESVLKTLIESQTKKFDDNDHRHGGPGPRDPGPHGRPPGGPHHGPIVVSQELMHARAHLQEFSQHMGALNTALQREVQTSPQLRPLALEAVEIKAMCDAIMRRVRFYRDARMVAQDFAPIDSRWRILAHKLSQVNNLGRAVAQSAENVDKVDRALCKCLNIDPQMDRGSLTRLTASIANDLHQLVQDVMYDSRRGNSRNQLVMDGRKLQMAVVSLNQSIARGATYDATVAQFTQFYGGWRNFVAGLRTVDSREVERDVRRIQKACRDVHDLLWLKLEADRSDLIYLAKLLHKDTDEICGLISVKDLLALDKPVEALAALADFSALCASFAQTVEGQTPLSDIMWDYRLLEVQWESSADMLKQFNSAEINRRLASAEETFGLLRDGMGIRPVMDYEIALEMASACDALSDNLLLSVGRCLARSSGYSGTFRRDVLTTCDQYCKATEQLHEAIVARAEPAEIRRRCQVMTSQWQRFRNQAERFDQADQQLIAKDVDQIEPLNARLQLLFAN
jgi:hypothetical protein